LKMRRLAPQSSSLTQLFLILVLLALPLTLSPLSHAPFFLSQPPARAMPSSFSWTGLRTDTIAVGFSVDEKIWYGGTGYLRIVTSGPGTYSDTKTTVAAITIPEGLSAEVYVCGDDRNPQTPPYDGWYIFGKYLRVYVDGVKVYELTGYWWGSCYSKAATIGPGEHRVELVAGASVWTNRTGSDTFVIGYATMDIGLRGSGSIQASNHTAEAVLDGKVEHVFAFRLPQATGVRNMSWRATWNGVEKAGNGAPGSVQTAVFEGVNRDQWVFTSPVVIRVGESVPSVNATDNYVIDAVYHAGSEEAGMHALAVALSNGDEVGFTSASYLVTEIRRETKVSGGTLIGSAIWANSNSTILFNQTVSYCDSIGWVTEKIREGVETGSAVTKVFEEINVSRRVGFSSKNRSDELELTTMLPKLTLVFTHIKISAERSGSNVNARACWAHEGSPVAGLRVRCFETDQSGVTDLDGCVSFRLVGSGLQATLYPVDSLNGIGVYEEARVRL